MNNIKEFPDYLPLDLSVRDAFLHSYRFSPPASADSVFNTLFGWRDYFNYRVSRQSGFLLVYYLREGRMTVLAPLQLEAMDPGLWGERFLELAGNLSAYCKKHAHSLEFSGIPEVYVKRLSQGKFNITDDRDSYDYVYLRSDLAKLEGRDYASKRNLVRQFEKNDTWNYEPLSSKNIGACRAFIEAWDIHEARIGMLGTGAYCMACRLIDNFDSLDLCGGLLYAGGRIVASTVASIVRDFSYIEGARPTAVVHHENGLTEYKGVYQQINRLFARNLPEDVVYVNREEDLGIAGLRKAKMSYNPALLIKKSSLTLI